MEAVGWASLDFSGYCRLAAQALLPRGVQSELHSVHCTNHTPVQLMDDGRVERGVPGRRGNRSKRLHRKRGEFVERTFEHVLDDGGMRRTHLCRHEKIRGRYLIHVAAFNLGLILRALLGFGTPKGWTDAAEGRLLRCASVLR